MGEPDGYFTSIPGANDYAPRHAASSYASAGVPPAPPPPHRQPHPPPPVLSSTSSSHPPPSTSRRPAAPSKRAKDPDSPPPEIDESLLPSDPKARRRERNRLAASAFRSRKKEKLETLESRLGKLEQENYGLKGEVDRLRSVLKDLGAAAAMSGLVDAQGREVRLDESLIDGPSRSGGGDPYAGMEDEDWDGAGRGRAGSRSDGGMSGSTAVEEDGDDTEEDVKPAARTRGGAATRGRAAKGKAQPKGKGKAGVAANVVAPPQLLPPPPPPSAPLIQKKPSPEQTHRQPSETYEDLDEFHPTPPSQNEYLHHEYPSQPDFTPSSSGSHYPHQPVYVQPAPLSSTSLAYAPAPTVPSGPVFAPPQAPASARDSHPSSSSSMSAPQQPLHLRRMPSASLLRNSIAVNSPSEESGSDSTPGGTIDYNPTLPIGASPSLQMPPLPMSGFTLPPLPLTPSTAAAFGGLTTPSRFLSGSGGSPFIPGSPFGPGSSLAMAGMMGFTGVAVSDVRSTPSPGLERGGFSWGGR